MQNKTDFNITDEFKLSKNQLESLVINEVVEKTIYPTIKADGKIAENENTTSLVFSPYSGRVTTIFYKIGDYVEAGDPLMIIESPDYLSALAKLRFAKTTELRQKERYKARTGALKDWQQAQAELETAKSNIFIQMGEAKAARLRTQIAKGDYKGPTEFNKDDVIITAPINGRIIQRQVGLGQYINSSGSTSPLFTVGDFSTVWLLANVREDDAPLIRLKQNADAKVLAYPDRNFSASIVYVAPTIDPVTHRLPVRAEIKNPDEALKPGMFASFSIIAGEGVTGTVIPESAIIYENSEAHVWVANINKGTINRRNITIKSISNGEAEILSGLARGEKIVVGGSLFIDRVVKTERENL
ncbi:MAG: efflux RND transporter periplasmic adaptor subunit [Rickettsiaceae bacterium]|nr:efflux RND transporter periplasmic adaptor subunit [Rickettsiaceae bacterium]